MTPELHVTTKLPKHMTKEPDDADRKVSALAMERSRLKAAIVLEHLVGELRNRVIDNSDASLRALLDVAEFNYKVSGMAAKQLAQENAGSKFSLVINLPGGKSVEITSPTAASTIDNPPQTEFQPRGDDFDDLPSLPPYLSAFLPASNDLTSPEAL